ncbi:hypothetical protein GRI97_08105 [Altererythrobacter xixiisoli]|uniref:DUF3168 domain-containing protein n=1 Tax=Croceibacterium xixiisoli TaxID=1476466 RepID=A0A6I4TUK4_9SPHN|nr:hypothetical protein [Croceibacterium xixiisoli]MXO98949.1 hypothetical protein [Croceibacterium xixiisoli]
MSEAAISKVEYRLGEILTAWPGLAGFTVKADASPADAIDPETIVIYTTSYKTVQSDEQGQTRHIATIEFETLTGPSAAGTVSRQNQNAIAHIVAALAADRSLGGMIEDVQEIDVAPLEANGRDHAAASLQTEVIFYTPRDDWFTIVGVGGVLF